MAAMQTTMIRASITAYSTAVGPSSAFRKLTSLLLIFCNMIHILSLSPDKRTVRRKKPSRGGLSRRFDCSPDDDVAPGRFLGGLTFRRPGGPRGTHGFASHPCGWFAFVEEPSSSARRWPRNDASVSGLGEGFVGLLHRSVAANMGHKLEAVKGR